MKVLHVTTSLSEKSGGPLRAILDLSGAALSLGIDSKIAGIAPLEINTNPLPEASFFQFRAGRSSYQHSAELDIWLRSNVKNFDLVLLHGMWQHPTYAAYRACREHHVPYVAFPHGMLDHWPVSGQGLLKRAKKTIYWYLREKSIFDHSACIFYTSKREMNNAAQIFSTLADKKIVVPYGVAAGNEAEHSAPEQVNLPLRAIFLSRIHPKKNLEFLIDAWDNARKPDGWELIIAGSGNPEYEKKIRSRIARCKSSSRIQMVGHVAGDQKVALFRSARWFLLPSQQENFGVAVSEALSYRCPVVISDQVYFGEYLHEESEILPIKKWEWVNFFQTRLGDEAYRRSLVEKDAAHLKETFAWPMIASNWADTLRSVANKRLHAHDCL